jgi:hypothetical protein
MRRASMVVRVLRWISRSLQTTQPMPRHSHQVFDSKGRSRGLVQRACQALGWSDGPEGVKGFVQASGSTPESTGASTTGSDGGRTGGGTSGSRGGNWSGFGSSVQGGNSPGNPTVVQPEPEHPIGGGALFGGLAGVDLHVIDGRLIACRPGEPPPLSVREHAKAFLEWLKAHDKVPGNEVPVVILEHVLYWDFLQDANLPAKPWRAVLAILANMPGVKKYQADWRDPAGDGTTPVVVKIGKPRRAKIVKLAERREAS